MAYHRSRSTREVLEDHLELRSHGRLEEDIERNYDPEVVCLSLTGGRRGHAGVREMAAELRRDCNTRAYRFQELQTEGEAGILVWAAECPRGSISEATDSYVVRNGRIVVHTVHYHVMHAHTTPDTPSRKCPE